MNQQNDNKQISQADLQREFDELLVYHKYDEEKLLALQNLINKVALINNLILDNFTEPMLPLDFVLESREYKLAKLLIDSGALTQEGLVVACNRAIVDEKIDFNNSSIKRFSDSIKQLSIIFSDINQDTIIRTHSETSSTVIKHHLSRIENKLKKGLDLQESGKINFNDVNIIKIESKIALDSILNIQTMLQSEGLCRSIDQNFIDNYFKDKLISTQEERNEQLHQIVLKPDLSRDPQLIVAYLIQQGVKLDEKNPNGKMIGDIALEVGYIPISEYLLKLGAPISKLIVSCAKSFNNNIDNGDAVEHLNKVLWDITPDKILLTHKQASSQQIQDSVKLIRYEINKLLLLIDGAMLTSDYATLIATECNIATKKMEDIEKILSDQELCTQINWNFFHSMSDTPIDFGDL